ncbi:MAG: hypothetical protein LUC20_02320 [Oscillospiraceae bacterium]|nr:hypothetical protein [Oscillospiraceae bacterium]
MCKLLEDMRNEAAATAAREAEIQSAIDTARRYDISEDKILADIMKQFGLTEEEAKEYMLRKSA